jgi:hypothetical protein
MLPAINEAATYLQTTLLSGSAMNKTLFVNQV